ncbi:MAG TPA: carboxymuconolactone decarboxylase family protein [Vicinamibacterales bacterium]
MMLDRENCRQEVTGRMADPGRLTPRTVRGYRELSEAGNTTGHLDAKTREFIAIAVGVTRQCDGCITTHVHAARKQGASDAEIAEALGVAIAVNVGAALVFSARVMDALAGQPAE